jgi:hypothetical protein
VSPTLTRAKKESFFVGAQIKYSLLGAFLWAYPGDSSHSKIPFLQVGVTGVGGRRG